MYLKASYTVEAAFIAPLAMMIFCWVILFSIDLHQMGKQEMMSYYENQISLKPTKSLRELVIRGN